MTIAIAKRASKSSHCPVCNGDHACSITTDGLHYCHRRHGEDTPGFFYLGEAQSGTWGMYRRDEDQHQHQRRRYSPRQHTTSPDQTYTRQRTNKTTTKSERTIVSRMDVRALTRTEAAALAAELGLPADVFTLLPVCFVENDTHNRRGYGFVWRDDNCQPIGMLVRQTNGTGKKPTAGRLGLSIPDGWLQRGEGDDGTGPIYLVEGPSDTLAASALGLSVIGRPSNMAGVELLIGLFAGMDQAELARRPIIVVGEHDEKPDGRCPGREGAVSTAHKLANALCRRVYWAFPPDGTKDTRAWLQANTSTSGTDDATNLATLGEAYTSDTIATATAIDPAGSDGHTELTGPTAGQIWSDHIAAGGTRPHADDATLAPLVKLSADSWMYLAPPPPCSFRVFLAHHQQPRARIAWIACRCWSCSSCIHQLKRDWTANITARLSEPRPGTGIDEPLHVGIVSAAAFRSAYKQIRRRGGRHIAIMNDADSHLIVATAPFTGSLPTACDEATAAAINAVRRLTLCTKPISTSRGWKLPADPRSGQWTRVGQIPNNITDRDVDDVLAESGVEPRTVNDPKGSRSGRIRRIREFNIPAWWGRDGVRNLYQSLCLGEYLPPGDIKFTVGKRPARPAHDKPKSFEDEWGPPNDNDASPDWEFSFNTTAASTQ